MSTAYPEPHAFFGIMDVCSLCSRPGHDDVHDVTKLVKEILDLSNKIKKLKDEGSAN